MIYYTKKKVNLLQQNVIVVEDVVDEDGKKSVEGYIVVTRDVYASAVILLDRFVGNMKTLLGKFPEERHMQDIRTFCKRVPRPLNVLGAFLCLVDDDVTFNNLEEMLGCLNIISMNIDFLNYLNVTPEIRKSITITEHQVASYKEYWEAAEMKVQLAEFDETSVTKEFIQEVTEATCRVVVDEVMTEVLEKMQRGGFVYPQYPQYPTYPTYPVSADTAPSPFAEQATQSEDELVVDEDDPWAALSACLEAVQSEEATEEDKKEAYDDQAETDSSYEADTEKEEEEKEEVSLIDQIAAMYGGNKR